MNAFPFTQFYVSLSIVLVSVALCMDWRATLRALGMLVIDLGRGFVNACRAFNDLFIRPIAVYMQMYRRPPGRHRAGIREPVTASEVDRWRGADDEFAQILHTMNMSWHINDQARA